MFRYDSGQGWVKGALTNKIVPELDTTSALLAEYLAQAEIRQIFGYPGTSNIEFMEAARRRDLDVVLARREGTAAFMAEAYGMLTQRPGVCISTLGPGSTALLNGVAAAYLDRAPLLAISGQIGSAREPYFTHQVVDHARLYAPVTKWAGRVEPGSAATVMRKALRTAMAERPGAVHLTLNADVALAEPTDAAVFLPPSQPAITGPSVYRRDSEDDPLAMVKAAQRPVVVAGGAAARADAASALVRLAEAIGLPVVTAPMAKGVFPEDHPKFAGVIDMACSEIIWDLLAESDLVIAVGFDPVELIKPWKISTPVLYIDSVPNVDQVYPAEVEIVGHIPGIIDWLREEIRQESRWTERELETHRTRLRKAYYGGRVRGRLNPTDVVDLLREAFPRETIATTDVGSHKLLVGQGWTTYRPRTMLISNGLSSMGFSLPAAIAAKIVHPDTPVVCTVGDGGFTMVQGELQLASIMKLGLVVVVLVDRSLNRIELKQMKLGYPSTATRLESMDYVALAQAMGCDSVRIEDAATLSRILAEIGNLSRPLLIETHIDPSQYEAQFS